jgi:sulfate permease, SulP family
MTTDVRRLAFPAWSLINLETFKLDLKAGITVSLIAIPQSLAYAQLAGVPPIHGLYAAIIPTIVGALCGSSGILSTGPVAMTSLLTAASIAPLANSGTEQFFAFAVLLALLSGLFQLGFGLMRMGVLLNFLSHPVLMGFINAAAIIIGLSQMPMLLGISSRQSEHFLLDIYNMSLRLNESDRLTLSFGLSSLISLAVFRAKLPQWPGVLITVAVLTAVSAAIDYEGRGGHVVGVIPRALPAFGLPPLDWNATVALLPASFVIALISFMEAMSSSKVIAIRTRTRWDENRELIGQGLAKIAAAFCQSMPVSGSFSRSALNLSAGAKTKFSSVVSAVFVCFALLFMTPLLHHLPKAVLAAIIMVAVANLVNVRIIRNAWRAKLDDGVAGTVTFFATLLFAPNIQNGILTGILLSLTMLLYRLSRPRIAVLGLKSDSQLRDAVRHQTEPLGPKLGAFRFDGALLFINVSYFEDAIIDIERNNPYLSHILVKGSGINQIDASGVEMLFNLVGRLKANGISLVFSGLKEQTFDVMNRSGLIREIGIGNFYATDEDALDNLRNLWQPRETSPGTPYVKAALAPVAPTLPATRKPVAVRPLYDGSGAMKIMVPVDGSPASLRAVEAAIQMTALAPGGFLVIFSAQNMADLGTDFGDVFLSENLKSRELDRFTLVALKPTIELCKAAGVAFETRQEVGPTARTIARVAEEEHVDQIVMASRAFSGTAGHYFKSVSAHVVELAKVPVTLVK